MARPMSLPPHGPSDLFITISIIDNKDSLDVDEDGDNFDEYEITNPPVGVSIQLVVRLNDGDHVPQEVHLVVVENLMIRE